MSIDTNFDYQMLKEAQEYGDQLRTNYKQRNLDMDEFENMSRLRWTEEEELKKRLPHLFITKSPDPSIAIKGVIRLLVAGDPIFHVMDEIEGEENKDLSSQLERMAKATWLAAGRARSDPVHYDVVRSAVVFDEIAIGVNNVRDMVDYFEGEKKELYQEIALYSPILYDVYDPRKGYPDWDMVGLKAFYREYEMYACEIEDSWGENAKLALGDYQKNQKKSVNPYSPYDKFTVSDMYLRKNRIVWLTGSNAIITQEDLPYGRIPIVSTIVQGSRIYSKPEDQREAFLYTLKESSLWKRQNLSLTGLYTGIGQLGLQPALMFEPGMDEDDWPEINTEGPLALIVRPRGSKLEPWINKGMLDDTSYRGMEMAERKGTESTIYPQALGAPLAGQVAYSTYALLGTSGRLPLIQIQRKASWAIGDAVRMGLRMMRIKGGTYTAKAESIYAEMKASDIPEHIELEARLEMALPQDQLASANAASILSDKQLVSKRWNRENLLQIEDSEAMDDEIMTEQAELMAFMQYVQSKIMQQQQKEAMPAGGQPGVEQGNQMVGLPGVMGTGGQQGLSEPGMAGAGESAGNIGMGGEGGPGMEGMV